MRWEIDSSVRKTGVEVFGEGGFAVGSHFLEYRTAVDIERKITTRCIIFWGNIMAVARDVCVWLSGGCGCDIHSKVKSIR